MYNVINFQVNLISSLFSLIFFSILYEPVNLLKISSLLPVYRVLLRSSLSSSIGLHFYTMPDQISTIFMFNMAKPSASNLLNHQANWFQFSELCTISVNPHIHLIILTSVLFVVPLSSARSYYQTTHTGCI